MARERFESTPCPTCACVAVADVVPRKDGQFRYAWHEPDESCGCGCHETWRIIHGRAVKRAAA